MTGPGPTPGGRARGEERGPRGGSLPWLALSAAVVVIDQASKAAAARYLVVHEPVPVLPGFNLTLTLNRGAAFSLLSDAGGWQRWLFSALAVGVSAVLVGWLRAIPRGEVWTPCALALVLGGALGNLWDRLTIGAVIDFVDLHAGGWHWPAFNLADSAICAGAVMLVAGTLLGRGDPPPR